MRTKNSIRNIASGIGGQVISQMINFINRTVFIYALGQEYLGVSGLFTNILSILSLAELGVGSAIIYSMYKPIAEDNKEKVKALMQLYAKSYRFIGVIVAAIGLILTLFLNLIIKDKPDIDHLYIIYWLFLLNSVSSYFFAYKRSIISASQMEYINIINDQKFNILRNLFQIISLVLVKNYILYLTIQVIFTWISNIWISKKANKMFPYLKEEVIEPLSTDEKRTISKNIFALLTQKIGSVAVNGTDNLLISTFVGLTQVGIASNYYMIVNMINSFMMPIFTGLTGSLGNLNASNDSEKSYEVYNTIWFVSFWIVSMCSICLYLLINPFITLWIGKEYLLEYNVVIIFVINFFISGMRKTNITYINTSGLFWKERYKPLFEAFINITVSIILLKQLGLIGVFLGTFISTLTTSFWVEPYIVYKYVFKKSIIHYIVQYIKYIAVLLGVGFVSEFITAFIVIDSLGTWILKAILLVILINILFGIIYYKNRNFNSILNILSRGRIGSKLSNKFIS